jgi:hypothetical protein
MADDALHALLRHAEGKQLCFSFADGGEILASFNYTGPPLGTVMLALLVAVAVILLLAATRSLVIGIIGGAISAGVAAWVVLGAGHGDLTGLMQLVYAPIVGILGGVAGGIAAAIAKALRNRSGEDKKEDKRGRESS